MPLLDDKALSGSVSVQRTIGPARHAVVTADLGSAFAAISSRCETWGGAAHLLIPADAGKVPTTGPWASFLREADFDRFEGEGVDKEALPRSLRMTPWPAALAIAIASLDHDRDSIAPVIVTSLEPGDPWQEAYLGVLGSLPNAPTPARLRTSRLREDLTYDDLLRVRRETTAGSGDDLLGRVSDYESVSPVDLSLLALQSFPASSQRSIGQEPIFPRDARTSTIVGPDIVVVYEPGSLEDLCLLWCLRAANGWPYGFPLAVPTSVDVPACIEHWDRSGASALGQSFSFADSKAVTSFSVDHATLAAIAASLGPAWRVAQPAELLRDAQPPGRVSVDIAAFDAGRAQLASWSPDDRRTFPRRYAADGGLDLRVRVRPLQRQLPPSRSLGARVIGNGEYHGGAYEQAAHKPDRLITLQWPTGWTVLTAYARDRGLSVRPSPAGRAAEALVHRIGSLDEVALLNSPQVFALLYRLAERSGMTWFRQRLNQLLGNLQTSGEDAASTAVEAYLAELAASPDDADRRSIPASDARTIGSAAEVEEWLAWAERSGVLVRGVIVECDGCGAKSWRSVGEISPPVVCSGCGIAIARPFRHDTLQFRYRITETMLRVLEHDALGHLLTLEWMAGLFRTGFDEPEALYGGHPGVEFIDERGVVVGEADVFLLFSDGSSAVGEYKRSGAGLKPEELEKLDRLAEAVGADWTFVATHDLSTTCPPLWKDCQRGLPSPRFVLTGERLLSVPIRAMGSHPFAWPGDDEEDTGHVGGSSPGSIAQWLRDLDHPDHELRQSWQYRELDDPLAPPAAQDRVESDSGEQPAE